MPAARPAARLGPTGQRRSGGSVGGRPDPRVAESGQRAREPRPGPGERGLGDLAAGTYVINERQTMRMPVPTAMPGQLAGWASAADIAALPDSLALAVRQFLHRAPTLAPAARQVLGEDLARQVGRFVAPQPPPGPGSGQGQGV